MKLENGHIVNWCCEDLKRIAIGEKHIDVFEFLLWRICPYCETKITCEKVKE